MLEWLNVIAGIALWIYILQGTLRTLFGDRARWRWDVVASARQRRRPRQYAAGYLTTWIGAFTGGASLPIFVNHFNAELFAVGAVIMIFGAAIERAGGKRPNYTRTTLQYRSAA